MPASRFQTAYRLALLLLIVSLCGRDWASAGGIVSSGGDHLTIERNPWFVGSAPIRVCFKSDARTFSLPEPAARKVFHKAFAAWADAWATVPPARTVHGAKPAPTKRLALKLDVVDCADGPELTIEFGLETTEAVGPEKLKRRHSLASSVMLDYSYKTERAVGVLWVAPDLGNLAYDNPTSPLAFRATRLWEQRPDRLYKVLLHELGHVFGFHHDSSRIMEEDYPALAAQGMFDENSPSDDDPLVFFLGAWRSLLGRVPVPEVCGGLASDRSRADAFADTFGLPHSIAKACFVPALEGKSLIARLETTGGTESRFSVLLSRTLAETAGNVTGRYFEKQHWKKFMPFRFLDRSDLVLYDAQAPAFGKMQDLTVLLKERYLLLSLPSSAGGGQLRFQLSKIVP